MRPKDSASSLRLIGTTIDLVTRYRQRSVQCIRVRHARACCPGYPRLGHTEDADGRERSPAMTKKPVNRAGKYFSSWGRCLASSRPTGVPAFAGTTRAETQDRKSHAARILAMKRSSSARSRVLSAESVRAEFSTSSDAEPVSVAPRLTSVILSATSWVPSATL